ncbi:MAG: tryptophan synthase subunit alpha, partial [Micrococcales bacterium]|nr:tryptophan synthase subunit alpha [Micrococcales bacterium]
MTRLEDVLAATRAEGRAALVAYLPVGYPSVPESLEAMRAVIEAGADVVEVGFPYSDPLMDGPVIQAAALRALEQGVRTTDIF